MTTLKPLTAAVPWGGPHLFPFLTQCDMIRTMTTNVGSLAEVRRLAPNTHVQMVVQLGEFIATPDPSRRHTSIRQAYALLATEGYADLVVRPDQAPEPIRFQWWGLGALRLDNTAKLDDYLRTQGQMIGATCTEDLDAGLVDSVHVDTAAWTMPAKREFLGCGLSGAPLTNWIEQRCQAFITGFQMEARIPVSVNGIDSFSLRLEEIAEGYGLENFGTRHYGNHRFPNLREAVVAQMNQAIAAIGYRPRLGIAVNPIPYSFQEREDMLTYLRVHAILYVGLQAHAAMTGVPVYWHVERDKNDLPLWVPQDYPMVWQQIINGGWTKVRTPLREDVLVILEKPGVRLTLSIDDQDVDHFVDQRDLESLVKINREAM